MKLPKVTFGMIVLNGEPFIRYNLRALYPFAHQIIIVEGASPAAAGIAASDGHSVDGTLDALRYFKSKEDPEDKLIILTAEDEGYPNGFWPGEKHEQSQAYARRATGDYLWQVDVDEFYRPEDTCRVLDVLRQDPSITAVSFKQITFWGWFDYTVDGWYLRRGGEIYHRLFKWAPDYRYITHRPPTVQNAQGQDLRQLHWIDGNAVASIGIFLYHYSLLFPKQVIEKCDYYKHADWAERTEAVQWVEKNYLKLRNPYRVHNVYDYPSWLERFNGVHSPQIELLRADLQAGKIDIALRSTDDIEQLLHSPLYRLGRSYLRSVEPLSHWWMPGSYWRARARRFVNDPNGSIKKLLRRVTLAGGRQL